MLKRALSLGLTVFLAIGLAVAVQFDIVYAYIDLGTGSFILQIFLATIFASLFTIKIFWKTLTRRASLILTRLHCFLSGLVHPSQTVPSRKRLSRKLRSRK